MKKTELCEKYSVTGCVHVTVLSFSLTYLKVRLHTSRGMAQVRQLSPKIGSPLALFCIHCVNRVNSSNDAWVMMTAP